MLNRTKNSKLMAAGLKFSDREQRIYNFLSETPIGVLSTVNPDGEPHGVVIYFVIDENFAISFLTKADTHKYDNLKRHNHVMLTVFDPKTQTTAQIMGKAIELTDDAEINAVADGMLAASLKTSDPGLPPISKLEAGDFVAFRIKPVQIQMAVYSRPDSGEYTDLFESIESFELHR